MAEPTLVIAETEGVFLLTANGKYRSVGKAAGRSSR
jgi:hypothetical protein